MDVHAKEGSTVKKMHVIPLAAKNTTLHQGCQIFIRTKYPNGKNVPNFHELHQMSIKYDKRL
jgi:hypothetical protein